MSPQLKWFFNEPAFSSPSQEVASAPSVVPPDLNNAHTLPALTITASHLSNCSQDNLITPMVAEIFSSSTFQVIIYFLLLVYLFLGIAIVSDIFMCSIEKITSKTKIIRIQCNSSSSNNNNNSNSKSRKRFDSVEITTNEIESNGNINSLNAPNWSFGEPKKSPHSDESTTLMEEIEVKVWNDTVANLTLMALGSSAPEILLSIIEIIGSGFKAGELGAGTIVGSAAFNLLIISAACVSALPDGVSKRIKYVSVFAITSFFSVFAYVWLLLILVVISPEIIELWEALITFCFFIVLVVGSYYADKSANKKNQHAPSNSETSTISRDQKLNYFPQGRITKKSLEVFLAEVKKIDPTLTEEDAACLAAAHLFENEHHSRMFYRVSAIRTLTGAPAPIPHLSNRLEAVYQALKDKTNAMVAFSRGYTDVVAGSVANAGDSRDLCGVFKVKINNNPPVTTCVKSKHKSHSRRSSKCTSTWSAINDSRASSPTSEYESLNITIIEFSSSIALAYENDGCITLEIVRLGKCDKRVTAMVKTLDHTAICNIDYVPINQAVVFAPGEQVKSVTIQIIDNNIWNPDRMFLAKLFLPDGSDDNLNVAIGSTSITAITIVNDDEPGSVSFASKMFTIAHDSDKAVIAVVRDHGSDGEMKVKFCVNDGTAKNGRDYLFFPSENEIKFTHGMKYHEIIIPLSSGNNGNNVEKELFFDIHLTSCVIETDDETRANCTGNKSHKEDENQEGSEKRSKVCRIGQNNKAVIVITHNDDVNTTKLLARINAARDGFRLNAQIWKDQIKSAISIDTEELTGILPWLLHVISFNWKVLFSLIPPPAIWGGWLTFISSLVIIGILTAIISDVASTFGCLIGIEKSLNAITFVAMGTSMPDLFASRTAVRMDSSADNAIGNITGSNSVNVFLGLGLPWLLAAIFWTSKGQYFKVPSGDLAFGVGLYAVIALIAISVLVVRRLTGTFGKGEVGGPKNWASATSALFICLWLLYIALSVLNVCHYI